LGTTVTDQSYIHKEINIRINSVLYGCKSWSFTLQKEQRFNVSEQATEENI